MASEPLSPKKNAQFSSRWLYAGISKVVDSHDQGEGTVSSELEHFCRVNRREEDPVISGEDGLQTLAATLSVAESAKRKTQIDLL